MNNSRSFESTVEQSTTGSSLCTINTEVEDGKIPDLNIADVSCDYLSEGIEHDATKKERSAGESTEGSVGRRQRPVEIIESPDWLPEGWTVEVRTRGLGNTAGSKDKYYIEPVTGKKFRSKVEVVSYLETGSVQRSKRKSQGTEFANSSASVTPSESVKRAPVDDLLVETSNPGSIGNIISHAQTSATQSAPVLSVEVDTLKKNVATSTSSANVSTKCMQVPSPQINLDNLRSFISNGIAPASPSMKNDSFEIGRSKCVTVKDNLHSGTCSFKTPAFPYTQDYWTTTLGTGASTSTNVTSVPPLWTGHFNSSSTYINGTSLAIPCFTSTMKTTSPLEGTTPHWLDRILNKGPSSSSSFGGFAQASIFNFGSTGGFVQSPLHYLQNAGAFQNSWLQIKPPATISQSQTPHYKSHFDDVPWKSSSWFDDKRESLRTSTGLQSSEKQERSTINLNQPLAEIPDEEKRTPIVHNDHRLNQTSGPNILTPAQRYSSHLGFPARAGKLEGSDSYMATASNGMWTPLNLPAGRMAPSATALESLWKKAVPITLEHREFIPFPNGAHAGSNFQRPDSRTTGGGGAGKKESSHFDLGVRKSHKVDKHQEKKRLENLGKNLCQQGLTGLLQELKDRTWLRFPSDKIP